MSSQRFTLSLLFFLVFIAGMFTGNIVNTLMVDRSNERTIENHLSKIDGQISDLQVSRHKILVKLDMPAD